MILIAQFLIKKDHDTLEKSIWSIEKKKDKKMDLVNKHQRT
jgi:hypothetical protein